MGHWFHQQSDPFLLLIHFQQQQFFLLSCDRPILESIRTAHLVHQMEQFCKKY